MKPKTEKILRIITLILPVLLYISVVTVWIIYHSLTSRITKGTFSQETIRYLIQNNIFGTLSWIGAIISLLLHFSIIAMVLIYAMTGSKKQIFIVIGTFVCSYITFIICMKLNANMNFMQIRSIINVIGLYPLYNILMNIYSAVAKTVEIPGMPQAAYSAIYSLHPIHEMINHIVAILFYVIMLGLNTITFFIGKNIYMKKRIAEERVAI